MSTENDQLINKLSIRAAIARKQSGMDQSKVSEYLGISVGTLSRYENGRRAIPVVIAQKLARLFNVSSSWLLTGEGPMLEESGTLDFLTPPGNKKSSVFGENSDDYMSNSRKPDPPNFEPYQDRNPVIRVPLISWVQAGEWHDPNCQTTPGYADAYEETASTTSKYAFALKIKGDSMEPEFTDGDIVIVDPERAVTNGSYVIAKNGTEATFKQYIMDGPSIYLKPLNERYPIKDMTGIEFRVVGVVVEKKKRY